MAVLIYNYTDAPIAETIRGTHVIVPARGHAETTAKKAKLLIGRFPRKLGLQQRHYTDEEIARARKLPADSARKALGDLMEGRPIDVGEYEPKPEPNSGDGK